MHQDELIEERQHIEHPPSTTYSQLTVVERIPSKTDTGLKILQCGIAEEGIAKMCVGIREVW